MGEVFIDTGNFLTDPRVEKHLAANRRWRERMLAQDPLFFEKLAHTQRPEILWIGCADSRVPANEIINLPPGEVFVHRNIANCVVHSDMNVLSVMEYAIRYLKVKRIILCGHYGCGGVKASMSDLRYGVIDNWLRHLRDVRRLHHTELDAIKDENARFRRMCELNVEEQVKNVCATTIVQEAWNDGQELSVHGWVYDVADGILHDLGIVVSDDNAVPVLYRTKTKA
uniref:Carbonic anhydrase n=1 Tax=Erythrolobus australicus TaxID=1077150 RepID=A0A7S1TMG6_9RHOD|mmetsp:Transcript_2328/g.6284  ORF Transcript_2328/g.6284 Transcript_2328/m.6284 type:complete len:226 (+) Transcript_2328:203-880(+)|eukprot:CAMPEP_0185832904 /NCGR_PEP_ID=MMETSP1353-20130828/2363_1 /TAXON_ID=1077150 /ORGANISM="Erythrolobus australicus, Strain CCMP3124" /LENGTH=225 /DNA_ID=CAMNT_0028531137 /DNA_START=129 /DNA_END=806 /DNA_ORIENTATION=-